MRSLRPLIALNFVTLLLLSSPFPCLFQEKVKFPIGAASKTLGYSPLWVASKQGFSDQQGVDAQLILLRGTRQSVQALVSGALYVAGATPDAVIEVTERGLDVVIVEGVINGLTHAIMGGKRYKNYEDLHGGPLAARV